MLTRFPVFSSVCKTAIINPWLLYRNDSGGCGMRMRSPVFVRNLRCAVFSAIRKRALLPLFGAQKNDLWLLWPGAIGLVRPAYPSGTRPVLRRCAYLPGSRGPARAVPPLRQGEARAAGFSCGQPVLHEALCSLCGTPLPASDGAGNCPGTPPGLGNGEAAGDAIHASPIGQSGHTGSKGYWHRRNLDTQATYVSYCRERSDTRPSHLVWRRRPFGSQPEAILRLVGRKTNQTHSPGGDGYVESVL